MRMGQTMIESMNIIVIVMHKERCLQMAFLNEERDSPVFQGHWTLRLGVISALHKSINCKTMCVILIVNQEASVRCGSIL